MGDRKCLAASVLCSEHSVKACVFERLLLASYAAELQPGPCCCQVKDLWERVATHEAGAASLACAAAAEDHGFPSSLGPEAAEEGEEQSISDIAPLDRLQSQAIERWQQVLVDARHVLTNYGLGMQIP